MPSTPGCSPCLTLCPQVHSLQELRRSASLATKVFVQRDYSDGTTCQFQTKFPPELESRVGSLTDCQGRGVPYGSALWGLRRKKGLKVWGLMGCCMALGQPVLLGAAALAGVQGLWCCWGLGGSGEGCRLSRSWYGGEVGRDLQFEASAGQGGEG